MHSPGFAPHVTVVRVQEPTSVVAVLWNPASPSPATRTVVMLNGPPTVVIGHDHPISSSPHNLADGRQQPLYALLVTQQVPTATEANMPRATIEPILFNDNLKGTPIYAG